MQELEDKMKTMQIELEKEKADHEKETAKEPQMNSAAEMPSYPTYADRTGPTVSELRVLKLEAELKLKDEAVLKLETERENEKKKR